MFQTTNQFILAITKIIPLVNIPVVPHKAVAEVSKIGKL